MSFEYHVIPGISIAELQAILNQRANEGWELASVVGDTIVAVVLKRPIDTPDPGEEA